MYCKYADYDTRNYIYDYYNLKINNFLILYYLYYIFIFNYIIRD